MAQSGTRRPREGADRSTSDSAGQQHQRRPRKSLNESSSSFSTENERTNVKGRKSRRREKSSSDAVPSTPIGKGSRSIGLSKEQLADAMVTPRRGTNNGASSTGAGSVRRREARPPRSPPTSTSNPMVTPRQDNGGGTDQARKVEARSPPCSPERRKEDPPASPSRTSRSAIDAPPSTSPRGTNSPSAAPASPRRRERSFKMEEYLNPPLSPTRNAATAAPLSPRRRDRSFQLGENSLTGSRNCSYPSGATGAASRVSELLSNMRSSFDVDVPRESISKRQQHEDCQSVASTVLSSKYDGLTKEEQAWAGIEGILDDNESMSTRDVLPESIINALSESFSSLPPPTSFRDQGKRQSQTNGETEGDEDDDKSHNEFMKELCGLKKKRRGTEMPALEDSSFSSLQSELTTAQSILSFVSQRNLIVQDDEGDNPMQEFIDNITGALERKQEAGPVPEGAEDGNAIFNMFSWSSKKNVDEIKHETQGKKAGYIQRHPEHELLFSPALTPSKTRALVSAENFNNSLPSLMSNNSMPSLSTCHTTDISINTQSRKDKWSSFGDLNFNATSSGLGTDDQAPIEAFANFDEGPQRPRLKKKILKKKKKMPPSALKKKKKVVRIMEPLKEVASEPEALMDYYKPATQSAPAEPKTPARTNKSVKFAVAPMRNLLTPMASGRFLSNRSLSKGNQYKDNKSPFNSFVSRMPKIFGKGRRNSPTSVSDPGRQESQFYPDMEEDEDEDEEWGLLGS